MAQTQISEKRRIRRKKPCGDQNEIFLSWINSRGGIEGYLFEANHAVKRISEKSFLIGKYVEEFETGESFITLLKKDSFRELTLIAPQVDNQTRAGLESMLSSPKVKMLRNGLNQEWDSVTGPKWQEVIVKDGRFDQGDTDENLFDFSFDIELQPMATLWA